MSEGLDEAGATVSRTRGALRLLRAAPRPLASWLLLAAGALLLFAAQFALWASDAVVDSDGFTERAVSALADEDVQRFVSNFLVEELIEEAGPGLIAARPLIEAAVQAVLGTPAFEQLYETSPPRDAPRALLRRAGRAATGGRRDRRGGHAGGLRPGARRGAAPARQPP